MAPKQRPRREEIEDDTPLCPAIAAELAFPGGGTTISCLRNEAAKARLRVELIAGKVFRALVVIGADVGRDAGVMGNYCR